MAGKPGATKSSEKNWRPRGMAAWLLTAVGGLLAVLMATLAVCMASPIRRDGLGNFVALALFFPLHLLVFTLLAAVLARLAKRCRARLAAWVFRLVAILTAFMAVAPAIAVWRNTMN